MKKAIVLTTLLITAVGMTRAQQADTVTVDLARTSKIVFTMQDRSDLEQLEQYDFDALFSDILSKLESGDTLVNPATDSTLINASPSDYYENDGDDDWDDDDDDEWDDDNDCDHDDWDHHHDRVWQSFNFDFGINNYLEDGSFPDYSGAQYTVRPWGSWYVGLNSILHTDVSQKFFIEWGFGVSWYNFKFQEDNTLVTKTPIATIFTEDQRPLDFEKAKLEATYLNVSIIPMYAFGANHHHSRWNHHGHDSFRIGIGPYAGYRVESHSKLVYNEDGDTEVEKEKDNFYLNNFRYGLRLQLGTQGIEFFTAYDLNPLFATGKGPDLHAITFGIVF